MIKLSRLADYSIVIMTQLAARPGSLVQAPDMALVTGLPVPTVAKTLKRLSHAGLLESQRGTKGGYVLVRDAADIPVTEIITAVDGPIALTDCTVEEDGVCEIEALCPTRTNWQSINRAMIEALSSVSLAEMAVPRVDFINQLPRRAAPALALAE